MVHEEVDFVKMADPRVRSMSKIGSVDTHRKASLYTVSTNLNCGVTKG